MAKFLKVLVSVVGLLVLLLIGASLVLSMYFDPNDYKNQINTLVYNKTGRHLQINGTIERSLFPWVGVKIQDVHLSNAPGFADQQPEFLNASEIDVQLELIPLLSRKIAIEEIKLKGLTVYLSKNAAGKTNWEDLTALQTQSNTEANTNSSVLSKLPENVRNALDVRHFDLSLKQLKLEDSNIFWDNAQNMQHVEVKQIALAADDIALNKPFNLKVHFNVNGIRPALNGNFDFSSSVMLSPAEKTYRFETLRLAQTAESQSIPKFTWIADSVQANLQQQTLSIPHALLTSGNFTATLALQAQQITTNPTMTGHLQIAQFNLKQLLQSLGHTIQTQDPTALQRVSLASDISTASNSMRFSNLAMTVDDTVLKGDLTIKDLAKKVIDFALEANQLNIDRYLSPTKTANTNSGLITSAVAMPTEHPPTFWDILRVYTLNGSLKIGEVMVSKTPMTNLLMHTDLQGGVLKLSPITANAYQGKVQGAVTIDLREPTPQYDIEGDLANVQISQLFSSEKLTGLANVKIGLTSQGDSQAEWLSSLRGNIHFTVVNGAFVGVNLNTLLTRVSEQVNQALALNPKNLPTNIALPISSNDRTEFTQFSGSAVIENGVLSNQDFVLESSGLLKVTGQGTANLVTQALNYHLTATGMATATPSSAVQQTHSFSLPLLVTGTFNHPIIIPDVRALAGTMLRAKIQQKIEKIQNNPTPIVAPAVREKVGKFLQRLQQ